MHIVDSYLELTTAPMTIRKFNEFKKEEKDIITSLDAASLYIIAKREVPHISLLKKLPEGVEKNDYVLPMQITLRESGAAIHAYYALPVYVEKAELPELKEAILKSDFEEVLGCASIGFGTVFFEPSEDIQMFFTYEVMYVGQCVGEPLCKRFKAHHALQDMLIDEEVITPGYQNADELIIMPFRSCGNICSILNPYEATVDDYIKVFTNDFSFGTREITLDCEKALVHGMNPKYNKTKFLTYPKSDDGLHKTEADVYSYFIADDLILKYDGGMIYGCSDSIYASRIVGDKDGFSNIYAPGEDYTKRYVEKMFQFHPEIN